MTEVEALSCVGLWSVSLILFTRLRSLTTSERHPKQERRPEQQRLQRRLQLRAICRWFQLSLVRRLRFAVEWPWSRSIAQWRQVEWRREWHGDASERSKQEGGRSGDSRAESVDLSRRQKRWIHAQLSIAIHLNAAHHSQCDRP